MGILLLNSVFLEQLKSCIYKIVDRTIPLDCTRRGAPGQLVRLPLRWSISFSYVSAHFCFSFCVSWLSSPIIFLPHHPLTFSVTSLSLSLSCFSCLSICLCPSPVSVSPAFYLQSVSQALSLSLLSFLLFPISLCPSFLLSVSLLSFSLSFPYLSVSLFLCFAATYYCKCKGLCHSRTHGSDAILSNMTGVFEENKKTEAKPFKVLQ